MTARTISETVLRCDRWITMLLAVVVIAPAAYAEFPEANSPTAYTDKQRTADELAYNRKRFITAYNTTGHMNPKWDAEANAFLEQVCQYLEFDALDPPFQPDNLPTAAQLARAGAHLVELGCDDAQVRYGYGVALTDLHRERDAYEQLKFVFAHKDDQKLLPESVASTANRLLKLPNLLSPDERTATLAAFETSCIEMARGTRPSPTERRLMAGFLIEMLDPDHAMETRVCDAIRTMKEADPWLVEYVCGVHEIHAAWGARGADLAFKVKPEGWVGFGTHLAAARADLTKAWKMEPTIPGPARSMLTVVMGDGGQGDSLRIWFDRALTANLDDRGACAQLLWALRPRWGGSQQDMLALGEDCAQTHRYDTTVPMWLLTAVHEIADDSHDKIGRTWADPEIYRKVEKMLGGYEEAMPAGRRRDWFRSWHAAVAWRAGKFDEARKQLEQLTTPVALDRFAYFSNKPELMVSQVYAFAGPNAEKAQRATADAEAGHTAEAAKAFRELADATPNDDKSAYYFDDYAAMLQTPIDLGGDDWVNLLPKRAVHGWNANAGKWNIDAKGRLVGTSDQAGLLLLTKMDLGRRYEVTATLEYQSPAGQPGALGLAIDANGQTFGNGLFYSTGYNDVSTYVNYVGAADSMKVSQVSTLHIETWDGRFIGTLNGQPVKIPEPKAPILNAGGTPRLAIYSLYPATDTTVYVSELKVRKLKEAPPSLGAPLNQ